MISVSVYTIIFSAIAYLMAFLRRKSKSENYTWCSIVLIVIGERLFPYLMLEDKEKVLYIGFAIELLIYVYLYLAEHELSFKKVNAPFIWALLQPASILAILCGSQRGIIVSLAGLVIIMQLHFYQRYLADKKGDKKETNNLVIEPAKHKFGNGKNNKTIAKSSNGREELRKADILGLAAITLVYALLVFQNIGSKTAPVTEYPMSITEGTNEITLDLGYDQYVSKVWVWLGNENTRCSYSWYSFDQSQWIIMNADYELDGVFKWRSFDANQYMQHLGMVFQTEPVIINEIVIQGSDGSIITPVNAGEYPNLFDEQDLFTDNPTYYEETMFDEVYHARTAYEFIYNYHIYEYTHPPLGKTLISLGIRMFGMTPLGWRFTCAVCGILLIPLSFAFAYALTGKRKESFLTTVLMCVGFMNYTLSRIGTIDIIVALFVMLMFYYMLLYVKNLTQARLDMKQAIRLMLCGLSTALAIATKWTGLYAALGIALMFFYGLFKYYYNESNREKMINELIKLLGVCLLSFVALPVLVYCLSYIEFIQAYPGQSLITTVIDNVKGIFYYHSGIKDYHTFQSDWYQWLINYRPLLDACNFVGSDTRTVSTFINPLICFGGLIAVIYNIYLWQVKKDDKALFLVIAYLSMLMPWLLVHRTVFIYQYFISVLIMVLMIGYSFSSLGLKRKKAWIVFAAFVVVAVCLFGYFYPVISGDPVSIEFVNDHMEWIESWVFA